MLGSWVREVVWYLVFCVQALEREEKGSEWWVSGSRLRLHEGQIFLTHRKLVIPPEWWVDRRGEVEAAVYLQERSVACVRV